MSITLCLALAIFHESRGEPIQGKYAVAEVVLNRTEERDKTVCEVIKEPNQFTWAKHQKNLKPPRTEDGSWTEAQEIAKSALQNQTNYTKGATYFNTKGVGVRFGKKKKASIGNHVFF